MQYRYHKLLRPLIHQTYDIGRRTRPWKKVSLDCQIGKDNGENDKMFSHSYKSSHERCRNDGPRSKPKYKQENNCEFTPDIKNYFPLKPGILTGTGR